MALPADFLDELRSRTPLPALVGRRVKIGRSGRQWKGCCPFHGEKTPSFYVYEDHFHCFGCGAHGDAISFVMQSQGAAFMEAVEQLAAEAGMEVPKPSPAAAEAERQRLDLVDVLARAAASFQRRLFLPEGARALGYLRGRGLSDDTIRRFGLGWSPGRGALVAELARQDIAPERLLEAGLMQPGEDGPARELFFERAMFPIRDRRGRVVSFGGRTLGDAQPKYLNGPETRVFSKRRSLYGLDVAREAARGGAPVVVVEGYMDVLALHQAGFPAAVAPLGTALTAEQLELLWQLSPEPILCFDGDAAGARAALRAIELALPLLAPDRTLAVAALPQQEDPDTFVRSKGGAAFKKILEAKRPLVEALFEGQREGLVPTSPESRAAYRSRLEAAAAQIGDRGLAREYRRALLDRFFAEARNGNAAGGPMRSGYSPGLRARAERRPPTRIILPAAAIPAEPNAERLSLLTAILLRHPALIPSVEEAYLQLPLEPWLARLREHVLRWAEHADVLDSTSLMNHLTEAGLGNDARRTLGLAAFALPAPAMREPASLGAVETRWRHFFGLLHAERLDVEIDAARREWDGGPEDATQRLITLAEARHKLRDGDDDGDIAE